MGAVFTVCCCRHYVQHSREENSAILRMRKTRARKAPAPAPSDSSDSDPAEEGIFGPNVSKSPPQAPLQRTELQAAPAAAAGSSRMEPDTELQAFLDLRDQTDHNTEEWEKLNYDIHTLRHARREVCARWKKILLQLGYQGEVEALLSVSSATQRQRCGGAGESARRRESLQRAGDLLQHLRDHSALFPPGGGGPQDRYLRDCLVALDSAEDFIRLATEKYPKTD
ncbi:hypothetical protein CRUP_001013 [Coryphaenoides rupestris]|nr:hypothetical protein CRUP_001013 [Coryphaenoides rupestris]